MPGWTEIEPVFNSLTVEKKGFEGQTEQNRDFHGEDIPGSGNVQIVTKSQQSMAFAQRRHSTPRQFQHSARSEPDPKRWE